MDNFSAVTFGTSVPTSLKPYNWGIVGVTLTGHIRDFGPDIIEAEQWRDLKTGLPGHIRDFGPDIIEAGPLAEAILKEEAVTFGTSVPTSLKHLDDTSALPATPSHIRDFGPDIIEAFARRTANSGSSGHIRDFGPDIIEAMINAPLAMNLCVTFGTSVPTTLKQPRRVNGDHVLVNSVCHRFSSLPLSSFAVSVPCS